MNPAIVIPSYWTSTEERVGGYDHATPVGTPNPELARCLESLEQVRGVVRTIILLVASPESERRARAQVDAICAEHPNLSPLVIGEAEGRVLQNCVMEIAPRLTGECVSLRGYGAIRNMGLVAAAVFGHDVVVFLDDDEVVLSPSFLAEAVYGLGQRTRQNLPVLVKSGYFIDENESCLASEDLAWYDSDWDKNLQFNRWMREAQAGPRISRSSFMCGGCMAICAEAYSRVAFDPFITRGEDMDYLFNLRLYGLDVWFDNQWRVMHLPPSTPRPANRFRQNVFRWVYERAKLARAATKIDLNQVTPESLMPYPGPWISDDLDRRIASTALRRALGTSDHAEYLAIWRSGLKEAAANAENHVLSYLSFMSWWPSIVSRLWSERQVAAWLFDHGTPPGIPAQNPYLASASTADSTMAAAQAQPEATGSMDEAWEDAQETVEAADEQEESLSAAKEALEASEQDAVSETDGAHGAQQ